MHFIWAKTTKFCAIQCSTVFRSYHLQPFIFGHYDLCQTKMTARWKKKDKMNLIFSSETAESISTRLCLNNHSKVPFQNADPQSKWPPWGKSKKWINFQKSHSIKPPCYHATLNQTLNHLSLGCCLPTLYFKWSTKMVSTGKFRLYYRTL